MQAKKLIVFDMDGVIVNSEPYHIQTCEALVRAFSGGHIGAREAHTVGISTVELYRRALAMCGVQGDAEALTARHFQETFLRIARAIPRPAPALLRLLDGLAARGVRTAVATSSPRGFVRDILELYGLAGRFETVVTGDDVPRLKPAPDAYLEALARCGVEAGEAAAIEDSHIGMQAALAAGLYCFGYVNPDSGNQDLSAASCRIHDLAEVLDVCFPPDA